MNLTEVSSVLKKNSPKDQLILIEWLVCLTFVFLFLLLPVGFVRRRHSSSMLKLFALGTYSAVTLLIAYIFGLMRNLGVVKHELIAIWAAFLLVVYGKTATTLGLGDQKSGGAYLAKQVVYITYIALMFSQTSYSFYIPLSLVLLFSDFFFKSRADFVLKSRDYILEDITVKSDEYMASSQRLISKCANHFSYSDLGYEDPDSDDDVPVASDHCHLLECRYVVDPKRLRIKDNKLEDRGTTIREVWYTYDRQEDYILRYARQSALQRTCLSLSLFWLLLHRFAGVPSFENTYPKRSWKFIQYGLLRIEDDPFEVIEVELAFLYDYFYNRKHFAFYKNKFWVELTRRLLFFGAISAVVVVTFKNYRPTDQTVRIQCHGHDMDVLVTGIVIVAIVALELVQFIRCLCSRWSKVRLLCVYLNRESWRKHNVWDYCVKTAAEILCPVRRKPYKPWQRKLGQYSLLDSCSYIQSSLFKSPLLYINSVVGIRIASPGRKESEAIPFSQEIKNDVIQALQHENHGVLRTQRITSFRGTLTLGFPQQLTAYYDNVAKTDAQVVLVWHIITSMCEIHPQVTPEIRQSPDFMVATSLSKYCAYLVAFAPDLLPGYPAATEATCTMAIEQAYACIRLFQVHTKKWLGYESTIQYKGLEQLALNLAPTFEENNYSMSQNFFVEGVGLGRYLIDGISEESGRWRVLAQFWAKMILHLAPNSSNEWAHAERLADGGEFITHLWALLFHAGIVDRETG